MRAALATLVALTLVAWFAFRAGAISNEERHANDYHRHTLNGVRPESMWKMDYLPTDEGVP